MIWKKCPSAEKWYIQLQCVRIFANSINSTKEFITSTQAKTLASVESVCTRRSNHTERMTAMLAQQQQQNNMSKFKKKWR